MTSARTRPVSAGHVSRLAAEFWSGAEGPPGFPRDPEPLIGLHLPVSVIGIPDLSCDAVSRWCVRRGLPAVEDAADRPLRGCLLAYAGHAFLLVDPADPPDQRRVTVAHELGHFLIEVWEPRRRTARALGDGALAVLDGRRPPTFDERLHALLCGASLDVHVHLMAREEDGRIACARTAAAECAADRFALELLAPGASLRADVVALAGRPLHHRRATVTELLIRRHELPPELAAAYAKDLVRDLTGGESVREWLRLST